MLHMSIKPKKMEVILKLKKPDCVKDVRRLLGIIKYYRDLWERHSHSIAPLTELAEGKKNKNKCMVRRI